MHTEPQRDARTLFEGVTQWEFGWKSYTAKLPVFYRDSSSFAAIYAAPTKAVRPLLRHPSLRPIELVPGTSLVAITAFEYRDSDIGPYNELSIAVLASIARRPIAGASFLAQLARGVTSAYVWQLPVTTEIARLGGVELYGYPKFLASIDFERGRGRIACQLGADGQNILRLSGPMLTTSRGTVVRIETYSVRDGIPLRANVITDHLEQAQSLYPRGVELSLGDHPIAAQLRALELGPRPLIYQYSPHTQSVLCAGRNLLDA
jgi:hypothetical protein